MKRIIFGTLFLFYITVLPFFAHAQAPFGGFDSFRFPNPEEPELCGCIPSPASQFPEIVFIPPDGPIMCVPATPPLDPTVNFFDFFFGYTTGFLAVPFTPLLFPSYHIAPGQQGLGFFTPGVAPVCGLIVPFEIPDSVDCGPFLCIAIPLPVIGTLDPMTGSSPPDTLP